jgi:ADP-heptose:LPS heptosyltransferase
MHISASGCLTYRSPECIAVVRALRVGDLLCAVPMLRALRKQWPSAQIALIGLPWAKVLLHRFPRYLDAFLEFPGWPGIPERTFDGVAWTRFLGEARRGAFDTVIQAHGNGSHINDFVLATPARCHAGFHPRGERAPRSGFMPYPDDRPEPARFRARGGCAAGGLRGRPGARARRAHSCGATGTGRRRCRGHGRSRQGPPRHCRASADS